MCVLLATDELIITVVARSSKTTSGTRKLDTNFELVDDSRAVIKWLIHTDDPVVALRIDPFKGYFPPKLDQIVLRSTALELAGNKVRAIALRYGGEVHLHTGISLDHTHPIKTDLLKAHEGADAIDDGGGDAIDLLLLKAEAPEVDQRSARHIVATTRVARDDDGLQEDFAQHRVHLLSLVAVDRRDEARGVEGIERVAEGVEG